MQNTRRGFVSENNSSTAHAPLLSLSENCPLQLCFLPHGTIIQSSIRRRGSPGDVGGCRSACARRRRRSLVPGMLIIWETPVGHT